MTSVTTHQFNKVFGRYICAYGFNELVSDVAGTLSLSG